MAFTPSLWGRGVLLTGLSPASSLTGYVAVITLDNVPTESIDDGANSALNGGGDLRFSTDSGGVSQLPCEVVSFVTSATPSSRSCQVWVRFPTYSSGAREVYMFYNRAGQTQPVSTDPFGSEAVWQDDILAMHMESTSPTDSTGNNTGISATAVSTATGLFGNALDFDGSTSFIDLGAAILPTGDFTQSVWINSDVLSGFRGIIGNWVPGDTGRTYIGTNSTSFNWDGYNTATNNRGTLSTGTWTLLTVARTGSTVEMSINGVISGSSLTDAGTPNAAHNTFIGALEQGTNYFYDGKIDLTRLSNNYTSQDKLASEYSNQSSPAAFWTTGTPFTPSGGLTILPTGITSAEAFGSPLIYLSTQILTPTSISSLEALGAPIILAGSVTLSPTGIASQELVGTPALIYAQIVSLSGISSKEAFGIAIVQDGVAVVIPVTDRSTYQQIAAYLATTGKFVSTQNNDIIVEWLKSEGVNADQFNDLFNKYWETNGYTGAYNDRWKKWKDS